jgi:hypothetical protein
MQKRQWPTTNKGGRSDGRALMHALRLAVTAKMLAGVIAPAPETAWSFFEGLKF